MKVALVKARLKHQCGHVCTWAGTADNAFLKTLQDSSCPQCEEMAAQPPANGSAINAAGNPSPLPKPAEAAALK